MSQVTVNATPTEHSLPFRPADFATLTEALDYAAQGETGSNFYTGRGAIYASLTYAELREQAIELAHQLLGLGLAKGDRVALVGFGSFSVSKRAARKGRNPQTGKEIKIAAKNVVKFSAGADLKNAVN